MVKQATLEKPFQYKDQAAAEKAVKEAKRKISELGTKASKLEKMHIGLEAIVASNLVLASAIMAAAGKPWTGDPFSSVDIEEAIKAFKSCVSSLKGEG